jgi:hypothetical protein
MPPLSESPSPEDVRSACDLLCNELLGEFPFTDVSDVAHVLAAMILPFVRRMIDGATPLHLIEAPTVGSGKGLVANVISIVATGAKCESCTLPEKDDDIRKMLTAELLRARPMILLDNADEGRDLHSPSLASVLTATTWTDRVLSQSKMVSVVNQALWLMTGNNPQLNLELTRRCVRVRIDPRLDRPWQREGFRHPDLVAWVRINRGVLVHAILTLVQAWIAAERPLHQRRLGSFERWSEVIGGVLAVAGVDGFLANLDQLYQQADQQTENWREFTSAWWVAFGETDKQVSDLNDFCEGRNLMLKVRGDGPPRSQQVRLGNALLRCRDRWFGDLRVVKAEPSSKHKGVTYYRVDNQ